MRRICLVVTLLALAACRSDRFYRRARPELCGLDQRSLRRKLGEPEGVRTNTVAAFLSAVEPWHAPGPELRTRLPAVPQDTAVLTCEWQRGRVLTTVWLLPAGADWRSFAAEDWNMEIIE